MNVPTSVFDHSSPTGAESSAAQTPLPFKGRGRGGVKELTNSKTNNYEKRNLEIHHPDDNRHLDGYPD